MDVEVVGLLVVLVPLERCRHLLNFVVELHENGVHGFLRARLNDVDHFADLLLKHHEMPALIGQLKHSGFSEGDTLWREGRG